MQVLTRDPINVKVNEIKLDKNNPNQMTSGQMSGLRKSMLEYGFLQPIIIDQDSNCIDGAHRLLIYKEFNIEDIPAYKLDLKTETERKMLRQILNKLRGQHEKKLDADELATIFQDNKLDQLSEMIAQEQDDLKRLIQRYHPEVAFARPEEFEQINEQDLQKMVPDTQLGDIYQLGNHRLICADNSDSRSIDSLIGDSKISQLNTDPPFGLRLGDRNAEMNEFDGSKRMTIQYENDNVTQNYRDMFNVIFKNISSHLSEYNTIYVFSGDKHFIDIIQSFEDSSMVYATLLVWIKNNDNFTRNDYRYQTEFIIYGWKGKHKFYGGYRSNILEYDRAVKHDYHPAMRPTELVQQLVTDGTKSGDNVLDVFAGSGSVLLACENTKRNFYGCEIDPRFCDIIIKRWEKYTGQKAVKL